VYTDAKNSPRMPARIMQEIEEVVSFMVGRIGIKPERATTLK
jgi:hypothetical protein